MGSSWERRKGSLLGLPFLYAEASMLGRAVSRECSPPDGASPLIAYPIPGDETDRLPLRLWRGSAWRSRQHLDTAG